MGGKVSCAPNSCEARSQVSLFRIYQKSLFRLIVKRLIFGLFWLQISAEKISNKNEHMFDCLIRVRIWQRALSSMTCSSLAMTHPRVKKRCFFFFTIIGEFLYDVPLQISENFCSCSLAGEHMFGWRVPAYRSSLFIKCSFQLICQLFDSVSYILELMSTVWQGIGIDSNVCSLSRHDRTFVRNIYSLSRGSTLIY